MRYLIILSIMSIFLSGCGSLYYLKESKQHKQVRKEGYELCHLDSCGPVALEKVFKNLGINKTHVDIGKEIQDADNTHYRSVLGLVHHKFNLITCPPELLKYCKSQGLIITKVKYEDLSKDNAAIILIKGYNDIEDWHWIDWPRTRSSVENFFGDDTRIISAYILSKDESNH